jgi:hypothetical protein
VQRTLRVHRTGALFSHPRDPGSVDVKSRNTCFAPYLPCGDAVITIVGMSSILLGRRRSGRPVQPVSPTVEPGELQLDWELGDLIPADVIDLQPVRPADEQRVRPMPTAHKQPHPAPFVNGPTPLTNAFSGPQAALHLKALAAALDDALEEWWSDDELPSLALLRDGLLALEAGHELDEGHRTLLLRTALSHRKGILTALRHQIDGERTAFLFKEALLNVWAPFPPDLLWRLKKEDPASRNWVVPLTQELADEVLVTSGIQQELAVRAVSALSKKSPPAIIQRSGRLGLVLRPLLPSAGRGGADGYWSPGRLLIVLLLAAILIGAFWWRGRLAATTLVVVAGGEYSLATPNGADEYIVSLAPYAIDRTEVTNASYRQCVKVGACPPPVSPASATRPAYAVDLAYDAYPAVNIPWTAAVQFCNWLDKRLPTADEWQVAAGFSPVAQRSYRYPWGDFYQVQVANVAEAQVGDTQPVGAYRPYGDSPAGLADMAGNVAEWTASPAPDSPDSYLIKGGSFLDGAHGVQVDATNSAPQEYAAPWLGFRCAVDLPS